MATAAQIKALTIIKEYRIAYASVFASKYFPDDHPGWRRMGAAGYGSTRGQGLILWAGGYLGKLRKRGLITGSGGGHEFRLTAEGKRILKNKL